jgi:hypothetical protein
MPTLQSVSIDVIIELRMLFKHLKPKVVLFTQHFSHYLNQNTTHLCYKYKLVNVA